MRGVKFDSLGCERVSYFMRNMLIFVMECNFGPNSKTVADFSWGGGQSHMQKTGAKSICKGLFDGNFSEKI